MRLLAHILRAYWSYFPIDKGKWRIWMFFSPRLPKSGFRTGVYEIQNGVRIWLDPNEDYLDWFLYFWNCWEPNETWLLRNLLRPGDTFVDVGANIGYFSLMAQKLVGPQGRIVSIEPFPKTLAKLRKNLSLNPGTECTIRECAVADNDAPVTLYEKPQNRGMNSMRKGGEVRQEYQVPCMRLDDLLADTGRINVVKMDIEGAEILALRGFRQGLAAANAPDLLCELTPAFCRQVGTEASEIHELLEQNGYLAYRIDNCRLTPISYDDALRIEQVNLYFTKKPPARLV